MTAPERPHGILILGRLVEYKNEVELFKPGQSVASKKLLQASCIHGTQLEFYCSQCEADLKREEQLLSHDD